MEWIIVIVLVLLLLAAVGPRAGYYGTASPLYDVLSLLILIGLIVASSGGGDEGESDTAASESDSGDNSGIETNSGNSENPPQADVTGVDCVVQEGVNWMKADVRITNNSSGRSDYFIEVAFEGADGSLLTSSNAIVQGLEPGQNTTAEAITADEPPADGAFECRVTEVDRTAAL